MQLMQAHKYNRWQKVLATCLLVAMVGAAVFTRPFIMPLSSEASDTITVRQHVHQITGDAYSHQSSFYVAPAVGHPSILEALTSADENEDNKRRQTAPVAGIHHQLKVYRPSLTSPLYNWGTLTENSRPLTQLPYFVLYCTYLI